MGLALPTWWVIQLVCRLSFDFSSIPEPLHQLDCLYNIDNRTVTANGQADSIEDFVYRQPNEAHRLYYHCLFKQEEKKTEDRIADCRSTDPPVPLYANDSESFDLDQEFPRRVSLTVVNLTTHSPATIVLPPTTSVWLTLPRFPYFNETLSRTVRLKCDKFFATDSYILCTLQTSDGEDDELYVLHRPRKWMYLLAVVAIAGGGLGNILVCLAVCLDRSLQNVTNYFLLSLAVADLLVSLFVMPLGAIQGFFGYWPLGIAWCNVYVSCDVLACSCSIMHMCCISLGRYFGISNPLKTRHTYSTKRLVGIKIAIVWALSLMVSGWVTFLGLHNSRNIMPEPYHCVINNQTFLGFGSLVAFYIPMIIMVVTYTRTVQLLRKKARFLQQKPGSEREAPTFRRLGGRFRKPSPSVETTSTISPTDVGRTQPTRSLRTPRKWRTTIFPRSTNKNTALSISSSQPSLTGTSARGTVPTNGTQRLADIGSIHIMSETSGNENNSGRSIRLRTLRLPLNVTPSNLNLRFLANRNKRQNVAAFANVVRTEQKASKVLGLVFLAFVLCWAPFFLLNIFFVFCPRPHCNHMPDHVVDITLWLGYISSTINPIIYTIFNRTFRSAFNRLLRCKCQRLSRPPRYRSVNENRNSTLLTQTPSSAAAGAATVPLSVSLQGTPLVTPSSGSSFLTNIRTPVTGNQSESFHLAESSTAT